MGKVEDQSVSTTVDSQSTEQNAENRCRVPGFVGFRCVLALVLGVAVLLSAVFWLPPFLQYGDQKDLDLDSQFGDHDMVASFKLDKPVSLLEDNILRLEGDIFDEIVAPTIKVEIIDLKPLAGSNTTEVVFAVVPAEKNSRVSSTDQSLIRASFESLVQLYTLRLTTPLFGDPYSFEVLKFPGGITIIPQQSAFPLQKVQILFNFTLNFSIRQIEANFNELTSQLKSGLRLAPYENLYISLINSEGSTMAPPTTVRTYVLLAIGNPSLARLRQLAHTITDSHAKNLGLNNTVFGRVKQVRLSSVLPSDTSPAPAPLPHPHHHHHRHHHHHHHHDAHLVPSVAPAPATKINGPAIKKDSPAGAPSAPAPAPVALSERSPKAKPPGCQFGYGRRLPRKAKKQYHVVPPVVPPIPPTYFAPSPRRQVNPPAPSSYQIPASSPLSKAVFANVQPPTKSEFDAEPPDITPSASPSPSSSSAGLLPTALWAILQFLVLVLHL